MLDHPVAISNKLKSKSSKQLRDLCQFLNTCSPSKLELINLLLLENHEDLIEKILEGLDDDYQSIINAINGHDTPISFDELHEKLINNELSLHQRTNTSSLSATVNPTHAMPIAGNNKNHSSRSSWITSPGPTGNLSSTNWDGLSALRPFLDRCQWCRIQGHVVS